MTLATATLSSSLAPSGLAVTHAARAIRNMVAGNHGVFDGDFAFSGCGFLHKGSRSSSTVAA